MPERTYRRADGDHIKDFGWVSDTDYFDESGACDVIEEEWVLVRYRTLRLGFHELCSKCHGEGDTERPINPETDDVTRGPIISVTCDRCGGDGNEPRDDDPPWTETDDARALRVGRAVIEGDLLEVAWNLIANASQGDWDRPWRGSRPHGHGVTPSSSSCHCSLPGRPRHDRLP